MKPTVCFGMEPTVCFGVLCSYFGQDNVLGKPDTGGQVVYILDQVRALEREMRKRITEQGLESIEPKILVVTRLIPDVSNALPGVVGRPVRLCCE